MCNILDILNIRVMAALRMIVSLNTWNFSPDGVLGSSFDPLGISVDPLGQVRRSYELVCKHVFQLLGKFGPMNQISEHVDKHENSSLVN